MSHPNRFHAPFEGCDNDRIQLPPEEAHHALRVARLKPGDAVSLFNGRGDEVSGVLVSSGKRDLFVEVHKSGHSSPPPIAVTVALGGLHQDKAQQEVIRRAVETGASRVCFWRADHSQRPITTQDRWLKAAIEACKQCGRSYFPRIDIASSLEAFLGTCPGPGFIGLIEADPTAPVTLEVSGSLTIVVGPEGDFSPREREVARTFGLTPVSLGDYVYRSETAAAMLMTLVAHQLGALGPPLRVCGAREGAAPAP